MSATARNRTAPIAAILLMSGCAQAPHKALTMADRATVHSIDVVAVVPQVELEVEVPGLDFEVQLKEELARELAAVTWARAGEVTISRKGDAFSRATLLRKSKAASVLFVQAGYHLSPDLAILIVAAQVSLLPAGTPRDVNDLGVQGQGIEDSGALPNPVYQNLIAVEARLPEAAAGEAGPSWTVGDLLRRSLQFQVAEVARLVVADLHYEVPTEAHTPVDELEDHGAIDEQLSGELARVVRYRDGTLTSYMRLARLVPELAGAGAPGAAPAPAEAAVSSTPAAATVITIAPAPAGEAAAVEVEEPVVGPVINTVPTGGSPVGKPLPLGSGAPAEPATAGR